jgi:hypothetical protein
MTDPNPNAKKPGFVQITIPILLSVMVFLLGIIAWGGQLFYNDFKEEHKTQQKINLQILENLGTINANCVIFDSDVKDLKLNDRRQDLILEQHETKLKIISP